ncbi:hypothetical protein SIO70_00960 [Chitinophaga sancti]|nr:hypothetical protein [Chitinophaga sancti]WPQ63432.1 hypothetical protein SIO70_00960 [Chitinophaga sancti]
MLDANPEDFEEGMNAKDIYVTNALEYLTQINSACIGKCRRY